MKLRDRKQDSGAKGTKAIHLWLVLWKAARAMEAYARHDIEGLGLCQSDFGVLEALLHKGPMGISALGAKVLLTSGSITAAVDRLVKRDLVDRRPAAGDRRARIVHLTRRGRIFIQRMFSEHEHSMERVFSPQGAAERKRLIAALRRIGLNAERLAKDLNTRRSQRTFGD